MVLRMVLFITFPFVALYSIFSVCYIRKFDVHREGLTLSQSRWDCACCSFLFSGHTKCVCASTWPVSFKRRGCRSKESMHEEVHGRAKLFGHCGIVSSFNRASALWLPITRFWPSVSPSDTRAKRARRSPRIGFNHANQSCCYYVY